MLQINPCVPLLLFHERLALPLKKIVYVCGFFFFLSGGGVWFSFWTRDLFHWRTQPDGKIYNSNTDGQRLEMSLKLLAGFHFTRSTLFTRNRMCVHPVAVYTQTFCCAVSRVVVVFFFIIIIHIDLMTQEMTFLLTRFVCCDAPPPFCIFTHKLVVVDSLILRIISLLFETAISFLCV